MSTAPLATPFFAARTTKDTVPLIRMPAEVDRSWLRSLPAHHSAWLQAQGKKLGKPGQVILTPADSGGGLDAVYFTPTAHAGASWSLAHMPGVLPEGRYALSDDALEGKGQATQAAFGWALAQLPDQRFLSEPEARAPRELVWPSAADRDEVAAWLEGVVLARRLVNTPAENLGPAELSDAARALVETFKGRMQEVVGEELRSEGFPAAYAVGKGALPSRAPRVMALRFTASKSAPTVALVGKGVVFDTGGLDIKPRSSMRHMKKDMGGAAVALGVARGLLESGANLNLLVVIGAVENAVSAGAFRPGDVLDTRKGLTVEVGDTDAEGRLVLADCLTFAGEQEPDLILDFATLTGAARVALGPDLPPVMARDRALSTALAAAGEAIGDPLWPMPMHMPYGQHLRSSIADMGNITEGFPFAGSITAGLFLERFVPKDVPWAHLDVFCWNPSSRPGRPAGGEAHAVRAAMNFLKSWKPAKKSGR